MSGKVTCGRIAVLPAAPGCPVVVAAARVPAVRQEDGVVRYASGWGQTPDEAFRACAWEIVERTSVQFTGAERILRCAPGLLDSDAVLPPDIMLFSELQYSMHGAQRDRARYPEDFPSRWSPEAAIDWVRAADALSSGGAAWLPAGLCFLGHTRDCSAGLAPADTNGVAAGSSIEDAAVRALVELIERDAVAIWWYNRLVRPQLEIAAVQDALVHRYAEWTAARRRPLRLINLTHDCELPVIAAVAHDPEGRFIALGFGAAASASEAARHAVGELAQFECNVALIEQRVGARGESGLASEALALLRWWHEARADQCPHLNILPKGRCPAARDALDLQGCHDICHRLQLRFLARDMTDRNGGMPVARVFAPGLRPMWPRFASGRLYEVPVRLGWLHRQLQPHELNPTPMIF